MLVILCIFFRCFRLHRYLYAQLAINSSFTKFNYGKCGRARKNLPGLFSLEAQKQDEMMFMELALRVRMRHEFDKEFGEVHFSMSYRDKVIVMSFPLTNDDVLLVSCEKNVDFGKIPFKILKIIESLKNKPVKTF